MPFRDEGSFNSSASLERRGGGTGAGRYVRHTAAKENKGLRIKDEGKKTY